ncbi:hypothetical protein [Streptomyces purpureus]|uniref:hypothetical protein n=1 Tax=Streptomyces purpureus TaxID=1951 RepID=UPI00035E284D|nr:hypothetical protein [Streptomyces purpureus]
MSLVLRRACATVVLLVGIALGFWVVFGAPHDWSGSMRLFRMGLGLSSMLLITVSSWLMFPNSSKDGDRADGDQTPAPGPLDV